MEEVSFVFEGMSPFIRVGGVTIPTRSRTYYKGAYLDSAYLMLENEKGELYVVDNEDEGVPGQFALPNQDADEVFKGKYGHDALREYLEDEGLSAIDLRHIRRVNTTNLSLDQEVRAPGVFRNVARIYSAMYKGPLTNLKGYWKTREELEKMAREGDLTPMSHVVVDKYFSKN